MRSEAEHIAISKSKGIHIDWKDGHHSDYSLGYLRDECPCATCTGAHGTEPQKTNYAVDEAKPANPFVTTCTDPSFAIVTTTSSMPTAQATRRMTIRTLPSACDVRSATTNPCGSLVRSVACTPYR